MATDQEIRDAGLKYVPKQKYLQNPFELPVTPAPDGGITNTNAFTNSGDNGQQFYTGSTNNLVSDFQSLIDDRQNRLNKPIDTSTFMGKISDFMNPQSANQIMAEGYQPKMKLGILANLLPDRYGKLSRADQAFIAQNMGYTGPTVFGENTSGLGKDPFGINTRSGFGNYADFVDKKAIDLTNTLGKGGKIAEKYGVSYDPVTGKFTGTDEDIETFKQQNKLNLTKLDFYRGKKKESQTLKMQEEMKKEEEEATRTANALRFKQEQDRLDSLVGTTVTDRNTGTSSVVQNESGGNNPGTSRRSDHAQAAGLGSNAGNVRSANRAGTGSAQSYNQNLADGGRAGYFFGGRVNYKQGGRINFRGGGMDMGNEENQKTSAEMGNTTVSNNNDGGNDNPPNFFVEDKTSVVDTSGLKSKSPEININYTDPRNYASLKSRVYNTNILDNDDINVDGTLSGEIGRVNYDVDFTDQGITGTNLKAGNFNAGIDANKNYRLGYANNYNGIDYGTTYDSNGNLMFNAGVKFKNGGLASIL